MKFSVDSFSSTKKFVLDKAFKCFTIVLIQYLTLAKINEFAYRKNGQEECRIKDVPDPIKETLQPYTRKCL